MKRDLRRIASIAAAMVLAVGMAASPLGVASVQAAGGLTISGNVVGAAGNLGGITVSGCTTDWNFCSGTFTTDASGNFALTGLESGKYFLEFDAVPVYQRGWYVGPGLTQDFQSAAPISAGATLADVQLAVAFKISGTLTGAAGGLSKLQVDACSDQFGCIDGTIDDGGNYVVSGLSPDSYALRVFEPLGMMSLDPNSPYVAGYYNGTGLTPRLDAALLIAVSDGDISVPVFDVPVGAVLRGAVNGSAGHLGGITVEACSLSYGTCVEASTIDTGSFSISGLWPDNYRIYFMDRSGTYVGGYYTPTGLVQDDNGFTPVTVGPDGTTLETVALQTASTIRGSVTGDPGHLGGIEVSACPTVGACGWAQTDDSGNFTVGGLPQGTYTLSFNDGSGYYAPGYYSDSGVTVTNADQATLITVPPSVSGLTVALTNVVSAGVPYAPYDLIATAGNGAATVSWTAGDPNGSAITGYTVAGSDGSGCVSATTTCIVSGLINGTSYTFTVTATNAIGTSSPSAPSDPVTPVGPAPAGAAKLGITAGSHTSVAGADVSVTVSALNKNGKVNTGYTGTVHFSSTDLRAVLPEDYTFTAADAGVHTFTLSLETAGGQSVTVSDGTLASRKWAINVKPGETSGLVVTGPAIAAAGTVAHYKVRAVDAFGNIVTADTSALSITSSDPAMSVSPASPSLVRGKRAFSVTFKTAGTQAIQVGETAKPWVMTLLDGIVVSPGKAVSISLTDLANPATAGVSTSVTATVHDRFGNVATGYVGTVHFTSNDKAALLPSDYTFTAANAGVHTFSVTLKTRGNRWVTLRDTSRHSIGGMGRTTVVAQLP
jgi:hypothetical protein